MFILNKRGQTPLDIMIEDELDDSISILDEKQETLESEKVKVRPTGYYSNPSKNQKGHSKVMAVDDSQMKSLVDSENDPEINMRRLEADAKYSDKLSKAIVLM